MIASAILADALDLIQAGLPRAWALAEAFACHTAHLAAPVQGELRRLLLGVA